MASRTACEVCAFLAEVFQSRRYCRQVESWRRSVSWEARNSKDRKIELEEEDEDEDEVEIEDDDEKEERLQVMFG